MFKVVCTCVIPFVIDENVFTGLPGVEFVYKPSGTEEEIIATARDANAVVVGREPYTGKVIANLKSCRLIATPKMGYDNIDVAAATEAGICVSCVSDASLEEVSDTAMALLLACARKVVKLDKAVRAGEWRILHGPEMERIWRGIAPIRGQTLGLIGFGRIPRALVPKAHGFGLKILAYDPYVPAEVMAKMGVELAALDRLLRESDYVSVHSALTRDNFHMLGAAQFKLMKRTAYLINTARGPLVDEKALYEALSSGTIAGAGLDVVEIEPINMDNPLLRLDNVIFSGHSGHYSDRAIANIRRRPAEDIMRIMAGEWPRGLINPEVSEKYIAKWGKAK